LKRVLLVAGLALAALAVVAIVIAREPLFWKRYLLAAIYSPATLPKSFYEPSETITGGDAFEPPRVDPELEHLDASALRAAAEYAGAHDTTALMVGRHGHIVFEQYWDERRSDAVLDLGDFNSTIIALMVGIAMGDRKIALAAEPISNYLEEFRNDERNAITIADLLVSSSGLSPPTGGFGPWSQSARERFGTQVRAMCLARKSGARPGEKWQPQVCDMQLLALVVERATREPYARYISERLWKPIGAADAQLAREDAAGAPRAECCLRARRGDWMRIAEMLVSDGRFEGEQIVPPGWVREMLAPSKANKNFGYQVWRGEPFTADPAGHGASERYAADDTYLLKGAGKARLWFIPSLGLSILRTGTNRESDADWDDARIPNLIVRGARDFVPKAAGDAQDLSTLVPNH
jgi:CubicO group peptidase (beta-lactamase class C family)